MLRKLLSTLICTFTLVGSAFTQGSISGTVTDANSGETLPGVNVVLTELQRGTATNIDGEYTISGIPAGEYTLRVTFIGFKRFTQQVKIEAGETTTQNIQLAADVLGLEEVVVSALGFEENRDEKGTAASRVSGEDIANSGEVDVVSGLSAKTAGVNITSSSGDPGSSSRIVIRGANTITGSNDPLFVVDGVPVYSATFGNDIEGVGNSVGGVSQQSRINDLNPEDIESVQVLKGPSAAAIWGSRAANGVVIIETKSGAPADDRKVNISVRSQVSIDELNKTQDLQRQFGQGSGGEFIHGSASSWGDKIAERPGGEDVMNNADGSAYIDADGNRSGIIDEKNSRQTYDHARLLFDNGYKWDNSVSISGGDDNGNFYLSIGDVSQEGIIWKNSNYDRTSFRAKSTRYFDDLTVSANAQYTKTTSDRIQKGSNTSGLLLGAYRTAPDFNPRPWTVDYIDSDGQVIPNRHRSYRNPVGASETPFYDNPFWTVENVPNRTEVDRIQGNTEITYDPLNWLSLTHRLGVDYYGDRRYELFPIYAANNPSGQLTEEEISQFQVNSDLILRASHAFNNDFSGEALLGWNLNQRKTDHVGANSSDIILETFPRDVSNYLSKNPFQYRETVRTSALYAVLNLNAYDMLFLELTGRSESASTFGPETDNTFFYPSASLAWQFSELNAFANNNWLSFGKLRISYGEAGIQPPVYSTTTTFFQDSFFGSWGDELNPEAYGGGYARSEEAGNPGLKVERTKELEFGTDLRFFDDRLELALTRYLTETEDAILGVDRAPSSGFSSQIANAASIENKGFEAELQVEVIRSRNFGWIASANWSRNINKVTSLAGAEEIGLSGFTGSTSSAVVGQQYGVLFGGQWRRASEEPISDTEAGNGYTVGDNDIILDGNGFPVQADAEGVVGDPNPDWRAGIGSTFQYKNISLNFLVDIKHGGDVWNGTRGALYFFGVHGDQVWERTAEQDLVNFAGETIPGGTTFRGYVEDFGAGPVAVDQSAFTAGPLSGFTGPFEQFIEDGGYIRLREVGINYNLSGQRFRNVTGLSSIDLGVKGRNLLLFTDYDGIDPETNLEGDVNGFGIDYFNNPNTRSWFFTLRVNY